MINDLDAALPDHHRLAAVRAHLHEMTGNTDAAINGYQAAAARTTSLAERQYLTAKAGQLQQPQIGPAEQP